MPPTDDYLPLFVYGSLRSGDRAAGLVDGDIITREPAVARGREVDTGVWYPGVVFGSQGDIPGELLWLDQNAFPDVLERLDAYEGVPSLFRRVRISVTTESGPTEAYAYEWNAAAQD
jgi:gamma-glutamylcyclotransferase (GGCT)/AIG2-like uncharacterized protein YtfP